MVAARLTLLEETMKQIIGIFCVTLIAGCATTSGSKSLTFNQQVYIALAASDGVAKTTDQLLTSGKISSATAQKIHDADQYLLTAVTAAQTTYRTSQTDGSNALVTALVALSTIESCLTNPATLPTCALPGVTP